MELFKVLFVTVYKKYVIVVIAFSYKYIVFVLLINVNDTLYLKNQNKIITISLQYALFNLVTGMQF